MKTQAEYLALIEKELLFLDQCKDERGWESSTETNYRASLLANRDVLERHKENQNKECSECFDKTGKDNYEPVSADFPCPTYTDVFNRIVEVMG